MSVPAKVFVQNGKLWWQTVYQPMEMTQEAPDRFFLKADDRTFVFVRDPAGKVIRVDITFPLDKTVYPLPRM